jgi:hypothetical protein
VWGHWLISRDPDSRVQSPTAGLMTSMADIPSGKERAFRWSGADVLLLSCGGCAKPPA